MESSEKRRFVDNWLDEALRQRGAIEPRPGLAGRIMANLRAESQRVTRTARWWQLVALAAVALVIAAAMLMSLERSRTPKLAVGHPDVPQRVPPEAHGSLPAPVAKIAGRHKFRNAMPQRQEQFPSPQPLSEQEKMLARYVRQFPRDAALLAEARAEFFKIERTEQGIPEQDALPTSDQLSNQPNP